MFFLAKTSNYDTKVKGFAIEMTKAATPPTHFAVVTLSDLTTVIKTGFREEIQFFVF